MKLLPLTDGGFTKVDDDVYDEFRHIVFWPDKRNDQLIYARMPFTKKPKMALHRLILCPNKTEQIDHIDGDGLNNLRSNLRICTTSQNRMNSRKTARRCVSKFKGVTKRGDCWFAKIVLSKAEHPLGRWPKEELAAKAYDLAARFMFREFSKTNFNRIELCSPDILRDVADRAMAMRRLLKAKGVYPTPDSKKNPFQARVSVFENSKSIHIHIGVFGDELSAINTRRNYIIDRYVSEINDLRVNNPEFGDVIQNMAMRAMEAIA